jgi:hypothetical protein
MKYIYVYSRTLEASNVWSDTVTVRGKINTARTTDLPGSGYYQYNSKK